VRTRTVYQWSQQQSAARFLVAFSRRWGEGNGQLAPNTAPKTHLGFGCGVRQTAFCCNIRNVQKRPHSSKCPVSYVAVFHPSAVYQLLKFAPCHSMLYFSVLQWFMFVCVVFLPSTVKRGGNIQSRELVLDKMAALELLQHHQQTRKPCIIAASVKCGHAAKAAEKHGVAPGSSAVSFARTARPRYHCTCRHPVSGCSLGTISQRKTLEAAEYYMKGTKQQCTAPASAPDAHACA
jgi:hypothetical protein